MGRTYSAEVRARFFELREQGVTIRHAAAEVGIYRSTGSEWVRKARVGAAWSQHGRKLTAAQREQFWSGMDTGLSIRAASAAAGMSEMTGRRWFEEAGGMVEIKRRAGIGVEDGVHAASGRLTFVERSQIDELCRAGRTPAQIAQLLGRHRSTIGRELARGHHRVSGRYRAKVGQQVLEQNLRRPKQRKLARGTRLYDTVADMLTKRLSPEEISGRLALEYDDPEMQVSHEAIYQALYVQARGGLRSEVAKALRTGRTHRKAQGRQPRDPRPKFDGISISDRPAEADDRAVPGHWEGDLIIGAKSGSAIGTLVERTTGFVILLHLPDDHSATTVSAAMAKAIKTLPERMWRSLTWDQGSEMAHHATITADTGLKIYFADPHSPWQRGSNENTNGLLRQYFPKGTDLSFHGPGILDNVAAELNARPRKRHGFYTPAEVMHDLLNSPPTSEAVAPTP